MRRADMRSSAFTLIELLVVIVLIAVLVAIIFPAMSNSRVVALSSKCQANLRQIGVALTSFTNENNNNLPQSAYGPTTAPTTNGPNYKWMDAIFPYAPSEKIFLCPGDTESKYTAARNLAAGQTSTDYGSYGMNGAYRDTGDGQTPPRSTAAVPISRLLIAEPATTVWIADTNNRQQANGSFGFTWANAGANPGITTSSTGQARQLEAIIERHRALTNVLFCDGHVETRRLEALTKMHSVVDPVDRATKNVMYQFTIEAD